MTRKTTACFVCTILKDKEQAIVVGALSYMSPFTPAEETGWHIAIRVEPSTRDWCDQLSEPSVSQKLSRPFFSRPFSPHQLIKGRIGPQSQECET